MKGVVLLLLTRVAQKVSQNTHNAHAMYLNGQMCTECGSIASMSNRGVFTIVLSETLEAYRLKAELI